MQRSKLAEEYTLADPNIRSGARGVRGPRFQTFGEGQFNMIPSISHLFLRWVGANVYKTGEP